MRRFTDLFKRSLVSTSDDEIQTPSFIKKDSPAPSSVASNAPRRAHQSSAVVTAPATPTVLAPVVNEWVAAPKPHINALDKDHERAPLQCDKIEVPVYENDSEWDVVQRSINLFADNAGLSGEVKQAFVKKWITELEKAEQTTLYRNEETSGGHLGNEINRAVANSTTGMLGTYHAMIHPGRQARMMDELKALRCVEKFDLAINDWQLAREVKIDLIATILGSIEEQKTASQNLVDKACKGQPEAAKIYAATKAFAAEREMRLNAAIKTAVLKMDAAKYQQLGLQSNEPPDSSAQSSPSSRQRSPANTSERRKSETNLAQPKASESAWVDEQALKLFGKAPR